MGKHNVNPYFADADRRAAPDAEHGPAIATAQAPDAINPSHYRSDSSGVECITITRHRNFNVGNAIKYLWRCGLKGAPIEDLEKAKWHIDDEIKRIKMQRVNAT